MKNLVIGKAEGSGVALSQAQEAFISKHLKASAYLSKSKKLRQELETAYISLGNKLSSLSDQIALIANTGTSKADMEKVSELRSRTATALTELGVKSKSLEKTTEKVKKAEQTVGVIYTDSMLYQLKLMTVDGRNLNVEGKIKTEKAKASSKLLELQTAFGEERSSVEERVREQAPLVVFSSPTIDTFHDDFVAFRNEIFSISEKDPSLTYEAAQLKVADIIGRMEARALVLTKELQDYTVSESFSGFLSDAKLKSDVQSEIAQADQWIEVLDRWQTAGAKEVKAERKRIVGLIDETFKDRKDVAPSGIPDLQKAQTKLLEDARALVSFAGRVVNAESELFAQDQAILLQQVVALENRMKATAKTVPSEQRTPINDFLATTRLSVTGIGGCNLDALKTAKSLIAEAETLVAQAEGIIEINKTIKSNIDLIKKAASGHTKEINPKFAAFAETVTAITEFEKTWMTKTPNDAKTESTEMLSKVNAMVVENDAIIKRRAEIARMIVQQETQLEKLNVLFKQMLQGTPLADKDYRGEFRQELETCRTWNNTKTSLAFYDTIVFKLATLTNKIDKMMSDITETMNMSDNDLLLAGLKAQSDFDAKVEQLKKAGNGKIDPAELQKAKSERDALQNKLNVRGELKGELMNAELADQKQIEAREKFLADSKIFISEVRSEQKSAADDAPINAYGDEVDRQIERLETTRDVIKKAGEGASGTAALSELEFVRKAIANIKARGEKTKKSALGLIKDQWDREVDAFSKVALKLIQTVEAFEKDQNAEVKASPELQKTFEKIIAQMNNNKFAGPAVVLGQDTPPATTAERKAAREQALDEVRRLKKLVFEDKLVQKCVLNPFGIAAFATSTLYRLEEIELNVLRGV